METDLFIGELVDRLTQEGLLEDTVLIFYADHYDYYMMDDQLNMQIKGVDNGNLLQHTDFFIWSADLAPTQIDKVTSSLDVLPTVANLFGLDTSGAFLAGHDGLGDQGGYVFFSDGSWYDGTTYWSSKNGGAGDEARSAEINRITTLSNRVLAEMTTGQRSNPLKEERQTSDANQEIQTNLARSAVLTLLLLVAAGLSISAFSWPCRVERGQLGGQSHPVFLEHPAGVSPAGPDLAGLRAGLAGLPGDGGADLPPHRRQLLQGDVSGMTPCSGRTCSACGRASRCPTSIRWR